MSREPDAAGGAAPGRPTGQPPTRPGAGRRHEPRTAVHRRRAGEPAAHRRLAAAATGGAPAPPPRRATSWSPSSPSSSASASGYARGYFSAGEVGGDGDGRRRARARASAPSPTQLEAKGVVKHARAFVIRAESDGYATRFKPGHLHASTRTSRTTRSSPSCSRASSRPPSRSTIPEGTTLRAGGATSWRARCTASPAADYVAVARDDPPPFRLEGYKPGTTLEGMLFPATYEVAAEGGKARSFVEAAARRRSTTNFAKVDMTRAAQGQPDRLRRGHHRLDDRPGGAGAGGAARSWRPSSGTVCARTCCCRSTPPSSTRSARPSRCSPTTTSRSTRRTTRTSTPGLPPTPISNPGLAALQAAADPAASTTSTTSPATTARAALLLHDLRPVPRRQGEGRGERRVTPRRRRRARQERGAARPI